MNETVAATNALEAASRVQERIDAVQSFVMHHVVDSHAWTLFPRLHVPLPGLLSAHGLMVILCAALLLLLFGVCYRKQDAVPRGLTNLLEFFVVFIRDQICVEFLGRDDGRKMTPLFCSFFFFILTMNLLGLVPCFQTATSNVNVTGALAVITFGFMIFGAIYRNGVAAFCHGFVPPGVPWPLLLIVVPIEVIGLFIKAFALMIRLFANMLAGHIVVFSLLGLVVIFGYVAIPTVLMGVFIDILEVFVAFFQAYIFTLLSAVFIGQRYHPAH